MNDDLRRTVERQAARLQAYCLCCGREIAEGECCTDCMRAIVEFIQPRTSVLDVMAEFDLTPEQAKIVLGAVAAWPEKRKA